MKRSGLLRFIAVAILVAPSAFCVTKSFDQNLSGLDIGAGTYLSPGFGGFPDYNPVKALAGSYTTLGTLPTSMLLPIKFGFFFSKPEVQFEIYGRYVMSSPGQWYGSGSNAGTGETKFSSLGAGIQAAFSLLQDSRFRLSVVVSGEYVHQRATLTYTPTGGTAQTLGIHATSLLPGGGLLAEVYLGDLWMLALNGSYVYGGKAASWSGSSTSFMGNSYSGVLTDSSGDAISAKFGGILVEASLRLAFD